MGNVTIKIIAQKAGVSEPTVSRVLNSKSKVTKLSHQRVLKIAKKLNYQPNHFAASLKTGKTNCIGISALTAHASFMTRFNDPYLGSVYSGIGEVLSRANNVKLIFHEVNQQSQSMEMAQKKMVDGMIFILFSKSLEDFEQIKSAVLRKISIPYVVIHSDQLDLSYNNVGTDFIQGGLTVTKHLINHGYQSIGCVTRPQPMPSFVANIFKGYQKALAFHHLRCDETMMMTATDTTIPAGYGLAERWLQSQRPLPRALVVLDNLICLGMLKKFREAGVRVPEDIALVTFEDEYPVFDDFFEVTAVVQPGIEKGRRAAELLLAAIDQPPGAIEARQIIVEPYLRVKKSCGCEKIADCGVRIAD
jgi:LacI family transcriptional regulator